MTIFFCIVQSSEHFIFICISFPHIPVFFFFYFHFLFTIWRQQAGCWNQRLTSSSQLTQLSSSDCSWIFMPCLVYLQIISEDRHLGYSLLNFSLIQRPPNWLTLSPRTDTHWGGEGLRNNYSILYWCVSPFLFRFIFLEWWSCNYRYG